MKISKIILNILIEKVLEFFREKGLIANKVMCPKCKPEKAMNLKERKIKDKYMWRCNNCSNLVSLRHGSIFEGTHTPLIKIALMICLMGNSN